MTTAETITYVDSHTPALDDLRELPAHVHVRASDRCLKNEDGPLCDDIDVQALREWATQAAINLWLIAHKPQGGVLPSSTFRDTLATFVHQAPPAIRVDAFETLAQATETTVVAPCQVCNGSGWWGARHHDPAHYASHIHCGACENPCQACEAGAGFKSPPPGS